MQDFTVRVRNALALKGIKIVGIVTHNQYLLDNEGKLMVCSSQEVELLAVWGAQ